MAVTPPGSNGRSPPTIYAVAFVRNQDLHRDQPTSRCPARRGAMKTFARVNCISSVTSGRIDKTNREGWCLIGTDALNPGDEKCGLRTFPLLANLSTRVDKMAT